MKIDGSYFALRQWYKRTEDISFTQTPTIEKESPLGHAASCWVPNHRNARKKYRRVKKCVYGCRGAIRLISSAETSSKIDSLADSKRYLVFEFGLVSKLDLATKLDLGGPSDRTCDRVHRG